MANNYCQFSSWMDIPREKINIAEDIIVKAYDELGDGDDYDGGVVAEIQIDSDGSGVWFHEDESGNPEDVEFIARSLIDLLELEEPFYCTWSYSCSKPRVDEFGGGAFIMKRNYETHWCDAFEEVQNYAKIYQT